MKRVVLFDFHNTIATCDCWLELEIKTLPGLALARLAENGSVEDVSPRMLAEATRLFQALRQEVREGGVEISAFEGARRVLAEMGVYPPDAELEGIVEQLEQACLADVQMVEGVDRALERLRGAGCRLGVVSSAGYPPFVEMALEVLGLRSYFSEVVTSAGEGKYKSDPALFRIAVERLAAEPSEAVHVGDHTAYDVKAAKAAGLSAVWFVTHARRTAKLHGWTWEQLAQEGADADATIERMDDLYEAIVGLGEK
jgi:HAD superfamily hydrolase (TIGR01549 family)